jgi:hypothetical protein
MRVWLRSAVTAALILVCGGVYADGFRVDLAIEEMRMSVGSVIPGETARVSTGWLCRDGESLYLPGYVRILEDEGDSFYFKAKVLKGNVVELTVEVADSAESDKELVEGFLDGLASSESCAHARKVMASDESVFYRVHSINGVESLSALHRNMVGKYGASQ